MKAKIAVLLLVLSACLVWAEGEDEFQTLPVDPNVSIKTLPNGLTYYIRQNAEPENRAYLRLVVDAGSILEDEDQLGLAHMAEHMAFNGTEKYAESEIIDYLESIGMRFGPEINAYTSFDETVYMLQVPTDDPAKLEKGFDILSQWAFHISFDNEEIDKERGVIIEEWRTGLGASERLRQEQFPILFQNSRYADRLPIGEMDVIANFEYDAIKRFYRDWYRPEHMAVIAVGDFSSMAIENLIANYFGTAKNVGSSRERPVYQVPEHSDTLYALASDPELPYTRISVYNKGPSTTLRSENDYRTMLINRLYSRMMNSRFSEISRSADPPFLAAESGLTSLVRNSGISYLSAVVEGNEVSPALITLAQEARRVIEFGFTQGEFDRSIRSVLSDIERTYRERDNAESQSYMEEYTRHFLTGEIAPGIELEYRLHNTLIPQISLDEINAIANAYLPESNRVVVVSAVLKDGFDPVESDDLEAAFTMAEGSAITPYQDVESDLPLLASSPQPGAITSSTYHEDVDITEWQLSNGVTVFLKPTDFKNDEIRFTAFSPGGTSMYAKEDYQSALYATSLISRSGIGVFSATALDKKLAGNTASVTPYIGSIEEGLRGKSNLADVETLFQLIFNYFTAPRWDEQAYLSLIRTLDTVAQNRTSQPGQVFSDRIRYLLSSGHYTSRPLSQDVIEDIDGNRAFEIYGERFTDADDFTFVFVGSTTPEEIELLLTKYVASLPSTGKLEQYRDVGIRRPREVVIDTVQAGIEPQSQVITIFHGDYEWSRENNYQLLSLADALRIRLREVLREDESGTYGVGVRANFERFPKERYTLQIYFGTSPDRAEELADLALNTIQEFTAVPPAELYLTKVKETQREQFELDLRENSFWLNGIKNAALHGRELNTIMSYQELIDALDAVDIARSASRYLDMSRYVRVILAPMNDQDG